MNAVEVVILIVVVMGIVIAIFGWDRYRKKDTGDSSSAQPTTEVFIDPESGRRMRVWYDAKTGQRDYRPE
jgi:hypothetical protein